MATVDVIIPVFNTPIRYVSAALSSVRAQTFGHWSAVVVNDGSSAATTQELERLIAGADDARIRLVTTENRGLPAARNRGIAESDSPLIAFLDSDDLWYPHKLETQVAAFDSNPGTDLVHAANDVLRGDDFDNLERVAPRDLGYNAFSPREALTRMLLGSYVGVVTVMMRREAGARAGFFDPGFRSLEDKELWVRMLLQGARFLHLADTVAVYRVHPHNMSKDFSRMLSGRLRLIEKIDGCEADWPGWLHQDWPGLRRRMRRHAYHEVVETCLESGRNAAALRYTMPWYSGVSSRAIRLAGASLAGMLGRRRTG
jgi:teichuronic acid biosynthesis glycosyltransferase TuaG